MVYRLKQNQQPISYKMSKAGNEEYSYPLSLGQVYMSNSPFFVGQVFYKFLLSLLFVIVNRNFVNLLIHV